MLTFYRGNVSRTVRAATVAAVGLALVGVQACASGSTPTSADSASPTTQQVAGRAVSGHLVRGSFFGIHAPGLPTFPRAAVGAVNLTTNGVYWPQIEPTQGGPWAWTHLDEVVQAARARHAKPLLVLGETPSFYSTTPHSSAPLSTTMPRMAAWRRYVHAVAARYKNTIDYEIWPEPDITQNWSGTPKQLAALTIAAAKIIHAVEGRPTVVSGAMVLRLPGERRFMDRLFAASVGGRHIGGYVDAVGIDAYPMEKGTPEDSLALVGKARAILRTHHVRKPLWNVEINYGVLGGHATTPLRWSDRKQSSYLVRNYVLDAGTGLARVYWLGWFRFREAAIQLVKADGVTPTRAARALQVVHGWLLGQRAMPCTHSAKTHVWSCRTTRAGRSSWVYWVSSGRASVRAPQGSRHVQTMYGATSGTRAGRRIAVTSAPVRVYH